MYYDNFIFIIMRYNHLVLQVDWIHCLLKDRGWAAIVDYFHLFRPLPIRGEYDGWSQNRLRAPLIF